MKDKRLEVDYYDEIAEALIQLFQANLKLSDKFIVKALIGEISSAIRTLIVNGYDAGEALNSFSKSVHRLHLDISILVENLESGAFEIIIFEVKKVKRLGLTELSQLIGYCLVSKCKFGILINVDNTASKDLSIILDADKDLTRISRFLDGVILEHRFGVMIWNSTTKKIEYSESGAIKSIPDLVHSVEESIK